MGALAWTMMGLALWHFTIFMPDHFWAGIVGAFLGCVFGAILFGFVDQRLHGARPGRDRRHDGARGGARLDHRRRARSTGSACATSASDEHGLAGLPAE